MKRIIELMGVLGVFCILGCSDDSNTSPLSPIADEIGVNSSAAENPKSSSSKQETKDPSSSSNSSSAADPAASSESSDKKKEPITIKEKVIVGDSGEVITSYVSSGVFCWTEGCEAQYASSSSKAKSSSSEKIVIEISSSSTVPPTVSGTQMIDNRNNKTYALMDVSGKKWMAEDLNFETSNSMCFDNDEGNCDTYGRLYTYAAATRACPEGWRLPNRDEAQALLNSESYPWSYSGRCKSGECGFTGQMGFHWTSATAQDGDKNFDSNKGDGYAVIVVEKEPGYAGDDNQKFFQVDDKNKFFSVRCIQDK